MRYDKVFTYYHDESQQFYIAGEVVNNTATHQRITTFMPVVFDENGVPVTSEQDFDVPLGYDQLREAISLAPDQSLAFNFRIYLPKDISVGDNYDISITAEPAEPAREDLDITYDSFDTTDLPELFWVEGTYENPGPDLNDYVAIVVTLYDDEERVIGMGLYYEEDESSYLTTGEHEFSVAVEMWEIVDYLELEVYSYKVQAFGN